MIHGTWTPTNVGYSRKLASGIELELELGETVGSFYVVVVDRERTVARCQLSMTTSNKPREDHQTIESARQQIEYFERAKLAATALGEALNPRPITRGA